MPPPPSYIDITSFPFTQTVTQAEFNGGTYGGVANEVWFRFVSPAFISKGLGSYTDSGGTFTPRVRLYENDGTTLVNTYDTSYGWWIFLPPDFWYIRINRLGGGASDFDFTVQFESASVITSPAIGDLIINDDSAVSSYPVGFMPATIWKTDGTFVGIAPNVPAGETGDGLPTGASLWQDRYGQHGVANSLALIDIDLSLIAGNINGSPSFGQFAIIANNGTDFYVVNRFVDNFVYKVTSAGVITGPIAHITFAWTLSAFGISNDGTIGYYARGDDTAAIGRWDMVNDIALSDLYTVPGFSVGSDYIALSSLNLNPGEILVLADDTIVTWWFEDGTGDSHLLHIAANGTLINEYVYGPEQINHIAYAPGNPDGINVWFFLDSPLGNNGRFGYLDLATGVVSPSFDRTLFNSGENLNVSDEIFGPSASCTMVTLGYPAAPPGGTGNLQIIKITVPSSNTTSFNFEAGGGLSPTTFALAHGEDQLYTGLTPGLGYSIIELNPAEWTTTYSVSNGSDIGNLLIVDGETTVVTVTNTLITPEPPVEGFSGIYKIVPGKRQDTIWTDVLANETMDVKIPNPKWRTGLVGE